MNGSPTGLNAGESSFNTAVAVGGSDGISMKVLLVDESGNLKTAGNGDGGAVTQSGIWTVQPGNTANTTAWKVDGSSVTQPVSGTFWPGTQPVSGTVTANAGTNLNTSALALDATLTGGTAKEIVRGGQKGATNTNADITHTSSGANHESLDVTLYDGSGNQIGLSASPVRVDPTGTTAQPVTGTFWPATQPVSAASLPLPTGAALDATVSAVTTAVNAVNTTLVSSQPVPAGNRIQNYLISAQLAAAMNAPQNGFSPIESPSFLAGL